MHLVSSLARATVEPTLNSAENIGFLDGVDLLLAGSVPSVLRRSHFDSDTR